jgi:hypothetical protein
MLIPSNSTKLTDGYYRRATAEQLAKTVRELGSRVETIVALLKKGEKADGKDEPEASPL